MRWTLDHQLYTHRARFSLRPYSVTSSALNWRSKGLVGKQPVWQGEVQVLEIGDLPPFRKEELMPPEEEVRPSLEFYYQAPMMEYIVPVEGGPKEMLDDFWTRVAKFVNEKSDKFMDKDRALRETVAAVAPAGDPPDARLRKLYERAQKIRNLSYLPPKSNAEADKLVENKNVEEVLRRGYGNDSDIADRKSTRLNSSHITISYAVFCLKKKKKKKKSTKKTKKQINTKKIQLTKKRTIRHNKQPNKQKL